MINFAIELNAAMSQSLTLLLPLGVVGIFVVFMMFNKKKKGEMESEVSSMAEPEHITLIKKWLKEKKDITNKSVHVSLISELTGKHKSKEEKNKTLYVLIFKTYDAKTKITSPEYAIQVESIRERISKSDYKFKYLVTQELDAVEANKKFSKEITKQDELIKKEELRKAKLIQKRKAAAEKAKLKLNKKK